MIHIVIGTKAQLIKMAPVMKMLKLNKVEYNYISTGQHKETITDILNNFDIKEPDYTIYSGKDITSIFQMAIWSIRLIFHTLMNKKKMFKSDKNGIVLVHGDTISTLIGAIMAKISWLKVGHVESGLRSFNLFQPFPEELIRVLVFRLSDYMFCSGDWAVKNLKKYKGIKINTGINTLYDSLKFALPSINSIADIEIPDHDYGIVTIHRFENMRNFSSMNKIVSAVKRISKVRKLIFILHKPTKIKLKKYGLYKDLKDDPNIELRNRYDYFRFIKLIIHSKFIVSDGGSNQEECYYLGKPVLLLRNVTERQEGLGRNAVLSSFDTKIIDEFMDDLDSYEFKFLELDQSPSVIIIESCKEFIE